MNAHGAVHAVPLEKLAQIKTGMSVEEVEEILGSEAHILSYDNGTKFISYTKVIGWCSVDIVLGSNDKVESIFHDH
ncbi:hypothetical protein [Rubritalea tangerina]|uniref:hypothetical protein n=1 Tax=Rubritalea tangerina TaxID=430798 RepID=UPI0036179B53